MTETPKTPDLAQVPGIVTTHLAEFFVAQRSMIAPLSDGEIYCMITSSVTLPELSAKYLQHHIRRLQNCLEKHQFPASSFREILPFTWPTNLLMAPRKTSATRVWFLWFFSGNGA